MPARSPRHEQPLKASAPEVWPENAYDEDGVDMTQIAQMLRLTPEERLEALHGFAKGVLELADALARRS